MEYTRITVRGTKRLADVVVPDDVPVHALLPELLRVLDEPAAGAHAVVLGTLVGEQLDSAKTLAEHEVGDGAQLLVTPVEEAPSHPDVAEVTEAVGQARMAHADRWGTRHASWAVALPSAALAAIVGSRAVDEGVGALVVLLIAAVAAGLAVLAARLARPASAIGLAAAAAGFGAPFAAALDLSPAAVPIAVALAFAAVVVAIVGGIGFRSRSAAIAGALGVLVVGAVALASAMDVANVTIAGFGAIVGVALISSLPAIALASSGLTALDDRIVEGERVSRTAVDVAIDRAFRTLSASIWVVAVPTAIAATVLVLADTVWTLLMALAAAIVIALRARMLPLGLQRLALLAAAAAPAVTWLSTTSALDGGWRVAVAALMVGALAGIAAARPSANAEATMRRTATVIEVVAVLSLIPLLLGHLGIYADLLEAFAP